MKLLAIRAVHHIASFTASQFLRRRPEETEDWRGRGEFAYSLLANIDTHPYCQHHAGLSFMHEISMQPLLKRDEEARAKIREQLERPKIIGIHAKDGRLSALFGGEPEAKQSSEYWSYVKE